MQLNVCHAPTTYSQAEQNKCIYTFIARRVHYEFQASLFARTRHTVLIMDFCNRFNIQIDSLCCTRKKLKYNDNTSVVLRKKTYTLRK